MTFIDYLLILVTIPMWIGLGRFFIKDIEVIPALLAGIAISGGTVAATCRIAPIFSREILIVFSFLGLYQIIKEKEYFSNYKAIPKSYAVITVLMIVLFREFHFTKLMYEPNMVVYFDPGIEMLQANYFGNLRVSVSYPSARAAMHLTPTGILASLITFIPNPNLFHFVEARFILVVIFFSDFIYRFLKRFAETTWLSWHMLQAVGGLICAGAIYSSELTYNLTVSSFLYVFCLLRLFSLAFENRFRTPETLFFLIILCSAKAPVVLIAVICTFIFSLFHLRYLMRKEIIISAFIFIANALTWKIIPPPSPESGSLSFIIPHSLNDFLGGGALLDPFLGSSEKSYFFQLIYIFIRIYIVFFILLLFKKPRQSLKFFGIYMFISILDLLFVRDTGNLITHQRHAYYFGGVVTAMALAETITVVPILLVPVIPIARIFMVGSVFAAIPQYHTHFGVPNIENHYTTYDEFTNNIRNNLPIIRNGFYTPDPSDAPWFIALKACMLGVRIKKGLVNLDQAGTNTTWILP